jgi:hypothetical protein
MNRSLTLKELIWLIVLVLIVMAGYPLIGAACGNAW